MQSDAKTVQEYLNNLPQNRKVPIEKVREVILKNIPDGIEEAMNWGMISYQVPLSTHPDTYNGQPLLFAALASQKNHMAVYLSAIYSDEKLRKDFIARYKLTNKRMDLGKSCVRFKKVEDLPLDLIGEVIAAMDLDTFIMTYELKTSKKSK